MEKNEKKSDDSTNYYGSINFTPKNETDWKERYRIMQQKSPATKIALKIAAGILHLLFNVLFYTIVIYVIIQGSKYAFTFAYQVFGSMPKDPEPGYEVEVQILKGESTMSIASKLEVSNVIQNKYSFYVKTKLKKYDIMPGTFVLNTSMDYDEILDVITNISNSIAEEKSIEDSQKAVP